MDPVKIVWLPSATDALDREFAHLAALNAQAARAVFVRIVALVRRLANFPESGRPGQIDGTRELVFPGLPYIVVYRVIGESVQILRVFHTRQDWPQA